jgi:hypothetical protein
MSAYTEPQTRVLRAIDHRTAEQPTQRTRFTVVTTPYPSEGVGECGECPSGGPINQAIGEVRYRSKLFKSLLNEATCLPCLPGLLSILSSLHESPLQVALYSPRPGGVTDQVRELDHERAEVLALLTVAKGPKTTAMLGQLFAAATAELHRVAGGGA